MLIPCRGLVCFLILTHLLILYCCFVSSAYKYYLSNDRQMGLVCLFRSWISKILHLLRKELLIYVPLGGRRGAIYHRASLIPSLSFGCRHINHLGSLGVRAHRKLPLLQLQAHQAYMSMNRRLLAAIPESLLLIGM